MQFRVNNNRRYQAEAERDQLQGTPNGAEQLSTRAIECSRAKPDPRAQIGTSLGKIKNNTQC